MVENNYAPLNVAFNDAVKNGVNHASSVYFATHYLRYHRAAIASLDVSQMADLIGVFTRTRDRGNTIYFAGNGGKCSLCAEFVNELSVALPDSCFKAHSLMENVAGLSGASNDFGWDEALSRRFEPLAVKGDLLVMLSGSGTSPNIIHLMYTAIRMGIYTVGIGRGDTLLKSVDMGIKIDAHEDGPTEDAILAINHIIYTWFLRHDRPQA